MKIKKIQNQVLRQSKGFKTSDLMRYTKSSRSTVLKALRPFIMNGSIHTDGYYYILTKKPNTYNLIEIAEKNLLISQLLIKNRKIYDDYIFISKKNDKISAINIHTLNRIMFREKDLRNCLIFDNNSQLSKEEYKKNQLLYNIANIYFQHREAILNDLQ